MFDKRMLISKYLLLFSSRRRDARPRESLFSHFIIICENVTYIVNIYRQRAEYIVLHGIVSMLFLVLTILQYSSVSIDNLSCSLAMNIDNPGDSFPFRRKTEFAPFQADFFCIIFPIRRCGYAGAHVRTGPWMHVM